MGNTAIQWTQNPDGSQGKTWNPVVGCEKVSQGCKLCYAKVTHDRRHKAYLEGKQVAPQYAHPFETVQLKPERLGYPLSWRKPQRVFVNSVSDLFHEDVPDYFIDRVFAVMACAPRHTFMVLTKRPERMASYFASFSSAGALLRAEDVCAWSDEMGMLAGHNTDPIKAIPRGLPNVWLGVSVENQAAADLRIPLLLQTPAAVHFLSCEPLLEGIDLGLHRGFCRACKTITPGTIDGHCMDPDSPCFGGEMGIDHALDWVIVGGESGKGARRFDLAWAHSIVEQCRKGGVAPFVKQLGARPVVTDLALIRGQCGAGRLPDGSGYLVETDDAHGGDMDEWPEDLRIREFPVMREAGE